MMRNKTDRRWSLRSNLFVTFQLVALNKFQAMHGKNDLNLYTLIHVASSSFYATGSSHEKLSCGMVLE